jgi:hypothetical protein
MPPQDYKRWLEACGGFAQSRSLCCSTYAVQRDNASHVDDVTQSCSPPPQDYKRWLEACGGFARSRGYVGSGRTIIRCCKRKQWISGDGRAEFTRQELRDAVTQNMEEIKAECNKKDEKIDDDKIQVGWGGQRRPDIVYKIDHGLR